MTTSVQSLLFALSLGAAWPVTAAPLDLGEHLTLRAHTGQALGRGLVEVLDLRSAGFVGNDSTICSALTGAAAGQVAARAHQPEDLRVVVIRSPEEAEAVVAALAAQPAIVLTLGGQLPAEQNQAMTTALLAALAGADYPGLLVLHVAVWGNRWVQQAAATDPTVAAWLEDNPRLHAMAIDAEAGQARLLRVAIDAEGQRPVETLASWPMNPGWLDLFRRSVAPRD